MSDQYSEAVVAGSWNGIIRTPESVPAKADIVIVGGGIVGVSTAWFLARQGIDVVLCEKGFIAGEQSGRNWGWVRQQGRDPRELPMMIESMRVWQTLAEEIGEDVGFTQSGCTYAARTRKDTESLQQWVQVAKEFELDTRLIDGAEIAGLVHGSSVSWDGALYTASDARAEPHKAGPAIARAAERHGATILTGCAVRGVETSAGAVSSVVTESGTIQCSTVLCAAGAWTSMFCRSLGISVPQLRVRATVARTTVARELFAGNLFDEDLGIRRRQDGGYTIAHGRVLNHSITPATFRFAFKFLPALRKEAKVLRIALNKEFFADLMAPRRWALDSASPFEHTRVLNPEPDQKVAAATLQSMRTIFPALHDVEIAESWGGMVETTPDVIPIIGPVAGMQGFHIATGFSGHGFGIGPGAGKAIAAMLTNTESSIDLAPFRLSRFFDGTPIEPYSIM